MVFWSTAAAIAAVTISVELVASDVVDVGDSTEATSSDVVRALMASEMAIESVSSDVVDFASESLLGLMIPSVASAVIVVELSSICVSAAPMIGSDPTSSE